jgi:hypothetical protein
VITKLLQQFGRPGVPLLRALSREKRRANRFSGSAHKSMVLDKLETVARGVASKSSRFTLKFFRARRLFYSKNFKRLSNSVF